MIIKTIYRFKEEEKAAPIKEIVIIICFLAAVSSFFFPNIRAEVGELFNKTTEGVEVAHEGTEWQEAAPLPEWEDGNTPPVVVIEEAVAEIVLDAPSVIFAETPIAFSVEGEGPFTVEWTGYNGGPSGAGGLTQTYPAGNHIITARITDSSGRTKTLTKEIEVKESYLVYTVGWNSVTISGYNGHEHGVYDVVIPEKIEGKPVTAIQMFAFNNKSLTSVVIPDSIKQIGESAFSYNKLTEVKLPNNKVTYGQSVFANNLIASFELPEVMDVIPRNIFSRNNITNLTVPAHVKKIDYGAFANNKIKTLVLSDGLEEIGVRSFESNKITKLILPNTVKKIGEHSFYTNSLTSIAFSQLMTDIPKGAFNDNSLGSLEIPGHIKTIGVDAFGSNPLKNLTLNEGLIEIGEGAFSWGSTINKVVLPHTLQKLGTKAFYYATVRTLEAKNPNTVYGTQLLYGSSPSVTTLIGPNNSTLKAYAEANGYAFQVK